MGKLIVELPEELHGELKKKAAADHKTLKDIVTGLVNNYLSAPEKEAPARKETGLCGSWDDERAAGEIIMDLKSHRRWFAKQRGEDGAVHT